VQMTRAEYDLITPVEGVIYEITDETVTPAVVETVPIAQGGTGATTAAAARTNLGLGTAATKDSTTSVTDGGTGLPTSGAVYSAIDDVRTDLSDYHVVPSRNHLKVYAPSKSIGTAIQCVRNANDSYTVTISETTASGTDYYITSPDGTTNKSSRPISEISNGMILSGAANDENLYLIITYRNASDGFISSQSQINGAITLAIPDGAAYYRVSIYIGTGHAAGSATLYPMISTAEDYAADPTYEPYFLPMRDGKLDVTDEQVLGAWNVLSVPSSVVTQTNNGVTFTITRNSSGQVTEVDANGTAGTGGSRFTFTSDNMIRKGRYYAKNGTGYSINYQENGVVNHSGNTDDFVVDWSQDIACRIVWDIAATVQVNHVKFYPQLALKPNLPFSPFVMTNAELTAAANRDSGVIATGYEYDCFGGICVINVNATVTLAANTWTVIHSALPYKANKTARAWLRTEADGGQRSIQTVIEDNGNGGSKFQVKCNEALNSAVIRGQIVYGVAN